MNSMITLYSKIAVLSTIDGELTDYNSQLSMYIVCEVHRIIKSSKEQREVQKNDSSGKNQTQYHS